MMEAGNPNSAVTEPQHPASIPEDDKVGNSEEPDLSERSIDTDVEAEEDSEGAERERESEAAEESASLPPLLPLTAK